MPNLATKPTPDQLAAFHHQIETGRITKERLHSVLFSCVELSPENKEVVDALAYNVNVWQGRFPGREIALVSRMARLLQWKKPYELRPADADRWNVFKRSIFWFKFDGVRLVNKKYLNCDAPLVPIKTSFANSIEYEVRPDFEDRLEAISEHFDNVYEPLFWHPINPGGQSGSFAWDIAPVLGVTNYAWLRKVGQENINDLLNDNLISTLRVAATLLMLNERIDDAYTLLEIWSSGNYPIGFDEEGQLVVLCE